MTMKKIFLLAFALMSLAPAVSARVKGPMADTNGVIDNTIDSLNKARTVRPVPGSSRVGDNPVLFLIGNSTMRTGTWGDGRNGQWGWGYFMPEYFDPDKITVENHALGGMSSRTFYNRLWPEIVDSIRPGDWVIIELGHNDNGPYDSGRARASIPGVGNDSLEVTIRETGIRETVYTYGEYMRRYIRDVSARGGNPVLMSLTVRNAWVDPDSTVIQRVDSTYGGWARQVAAETGVPFADLNRVVADKYEQWGKERVRTMFHIDRIHTSERGARINAACAAEALALVPGLRLADMLLPDSTEYVRGAVPMTFVAGNRRPLHEPSGSVALSALNGSSSVRSFFDEGEWDYFFNMLAPGDTLVLAFDPVNLAADLDKGELAAADGPDKVVKMPSTGRFRVVYPFERYIEMIRTDCLIKGVTLIIE